MPIKYVRRSGLIIPSEDTLQKVLHDMKRNAEMKKEAFLDKYPNMAPQLNAIIELAIHADRGVWEQGLAPYKDLPFYDALKALIIYSRIGNR